MNLGIKETRSGSGLTYGEGFEGQIREFIFMQRYFNQTDVKKIQNSVLSWRMQILGYYRLMDGSLEDRNRALMGSAISIDDSTLMQ